MAERHTFIEYPHASLELQASAFQPPRAKNIRLLRRSRKQEKFAPGEVVFADSDGMYLYDQTGKLNKNGVPCRKLSNTYRVIDKGNKVVCIRK